jgi:hypothetical protein
MGEQDAVVPGDSTPVDDGWEPESEPRGPIAFFRDHPSAFFGWLGTIVFVGGWGVAIWVFVDNPFGDNSLPYPTSYRLQLMVTLGAAVTLAAGVLWAIAVYIWLHYLPDLPPELVAQLAHADHAHPDHAHDHAH